MNIIKDGSYGPDGHVEGVLFALERSIVKSLKDLNDKKLLQKPQLDDGAAQKIAMRIRQSLSKHFGGVWHVLACTDDFVVKTAMSPLPEIVVKCRAAQYVWIIFQHSASQGIESLNMTKLRREVFKNSRLMLLVLGALTVFYFQSYCGGSLSPAGGPDDETEGMILTSCVSFP